MPHFVSEINIAMITLTENVGVIFSKAEYTLKTYLVDRDTFQWRKGRGVPSSVRIILSHIPVGRFLFYGLCPVRTLGNILLQAGTGKENAAVWHILHISDKSVVSCCVQGRNADAQKLRRLSAGIQFFHCCSHSFHCFAVDGKADTQRPCYILHLFVRQTSDIRPHPTFI